MLKTKFWESFCEREGEDGETDEEEISIFGDKGRDGVDNKGLGG